MLPVANMFAATLAAVPAAGEFVRTRLREAYGEQRACDALELAAGEAFANIVRHGDGGRSIELRCSLAPGEACIDILDDAAPFDMTAIAATLPDDPMAEGGRGLWIIRNGVERFEYVREAGRNRHRLAISIAR